jgi:hypothetical protein
MSVNAARLIPESWAPHPVAASPPMRRATRRRMSGKPGKRIHAKARLIDDLERDLLKLKSLVKVLKSMGIDPASPNARLLVRLMLVNLFFWHQSDRETAASDCTQRDDVDQRP